MRWTGVTLQRLGRIMRVAGRHGIALALERSAVRFALLRRLPIPGGIMPKPERLRVAFEELGGTFVKFGQMLALQPDILPLDYCNALFKLLDRIEPFPFREAERIFVAELGTRPDEVFESFDPKPLATASVGQVYTGFYRGQKVAVKIQRPSVQAEFHADIRLMATAITLIQRLRLGSCEWMIEPTREFIAWSREELDYRNEARYGAELGRFAVGNPVQRVLKVFPELTTERTLVTEFMTGTTLLDYLRGMENGDQVLIKRLEARGFDRQVFAGNIIANFVGDAFRHGIYHADLHPANLIILDNNQVGYIDFGITGQMSRYSRRHLLAMTLALSRGDLEAIKAEYLKITVHDATSNIAAFRAGVDRLALAWYDHHGGQRRLAAKITKIFNEMLTLSRQTRVMPERDIVKYIRSSIAIDGLLARFAPGFDIGAHLGTHCADILLWESRRGLVAPANVLAWGSASHRLLGDGPARLLSAFERLGGGAEPTALGTSEARSVAPGDGQALGQRALALGLATAGAALLVALGPPASSAASPWGLNLFTAELAFAAAAALALLSTLRRLV